VQAPLQQAQQQEDEEQEAAEEGAAASPAAGGGGGGPLDPEALLQARLQEAIASGAAPPGTTLEQLMDSMAAFMAEANGKTALHQYVARVMLGLFTVADAMGLPTPCGRASLQRTQTAHCAVHTVAAQPLHTVAAQPLHTVEAQPLHTVEAQPLHTVEAQPLHGTA
jgi:hypothetical protein